MVIFLVAKFVRSENVRVSGESETGGKESGKGKGSKHSLSRAMRGTRRTKTINQHGKKEHGTKRECKTYRYREPFQLEGGDIAPTNP